MPHKTEITNSNTIAACSTPVGVGGIGVIRVSGALVPQIAKALFGKIPRPRYATYAVFRDSKGIAIDEGLAIYFKAPSSFTGEDVLELQGHGGPVVVDCILQRLVELGAHVAKPGEFSKRAFLNGKIDLTQAEAIMDLISSSSKQASQSAMKSLQGAFAHLINHLTSNLVKLRTQIEANIDFPEEELDLKGKKALENEFDSILQTLEKIQKRAEQGLLLHDGITVVIAGKPNVGKSSLLNHFTGYETAIVTDIPGTTRDVLRANIQIDGLPITILDTAGLKTNTEDPIEQEGIRRALKEIEKADLILFIIDASLSKKRNPKSLLRDHALFQHAMHAFSHIVVYNKIDLTNEDAKIVKDGNISSVYVSAKTGSGIDLLKEHLKNIACASGAKESELVFSARRRHLEALSLANAQIQSAKNNLTTNSYLELVAEDLRQAQNSLNEITGDFTSEDLLDRIFSEFCIGK